MAMNPGLETWDLVVRLSKLRADVGEETQDGWAGTGKLAEQIEACWLVDRKMVVDWAVYGFHIIVECEGYLDH